MKSEDCRRYHEDPEANAAHLATCAECRAVDEQLRAPVNNRKLRIETLPLAPWEGASFRSWPLVAGGALAVIAIAAAFFAAAGASPLLVLEALRNAVPSGQIVQSFVQLGSGIVRHAPVAILLAFLVVNAILFALLRRAPKGIDV